MPKVTVLDVRLNGEPVATLTNLQDGRTIFAFNTDYIENEKRENGRVVTGRAGVPGSYAATPLLFENTAGSLCGALLPTGREVDEIDGISATLIDNGMPCVVILASDLGVTGLETREELEANEERKQRVEKIRLVAGPMMNLGDVKSASVPKMVLVSAPTSGGAINTRCFIPHRVHATVGVLAAVTIATATRLKQSPAHGSRCS